MRITPLQIIQYAAYLILLAIAGALEYFNLLPKNSTASVFLLVVGHFFGNTPMTAALVQNTQVTRENTQATAAGNAASNTIQPPTGPIHVVLHNEQPPVQSSPPAPPINLTADKEAIGKAVLSKMQSITPPIPETPTGPIPVVKVETIRALAGTITNAPGNYVTGTAPINFGETAKVPLVQGVQS